MKNVVKIFSLSMMLVMTAAGAAMATPSTQIWIPSTDIQPFADLHLNIDSYFRASAKSKAGSPTGRDTNVWDIGPTIGILPFQKIQAEVGFDYLVNSSNPNDNHPFCGNFKIGTPEDAFFKFMPAFAVGMWNIGPSSYEGPAGGNGVGRAPFISSGQNIAYALVARTLPAIGPVPSLGRISAGGYHGSQRALVDPNGHSANEGVLLSWDRTMTEINDKLWLAVDYMGGNNVNGAVSVGASWAFSKNVSVIFGYDIWKEKALAGNNTFTV
ncbi:MAG TPA: hypothetical protein VMJ66_01445 [Geobacteraceae bacterium]|nr:hypothetical protein [Geobacteraceae bacterium]